MTARILIARALVAVMLAGGIFQAGRSVLGWTSQRKGEDADLRAFIEECRRAIPEDAAVLLAGGFHPYHAAAGLYPRPVRLCAEAETRDLAARHPDAWVVAYPMPFDKTKTTMVKARDLR